MKLHFAIKPSKLCLLQALPNVLTNSLIVEQIAHWTLICHQCCLEDQRWLRLPYKLNRIGFKTYENLATTKLAKAALEAGSLKWITRKAGPGLRNFACSIGALGRELGLFEFGRCIRLLWPRTRVKASEATRVQDVRRLPSQGHKNTSLALPESK